MKTGKQKGTDPYARQSSSHAKMVVIGTLHGGVTPFEELEELFEQYRPTQLFIEMVQKDVEKGRIKKYHEEMQRAYRWAKDHNVNMCAFDAAITPTKKALSKKENDQLIEACKKRIRGLTWKDLNREEYDHVFDRILKGYIDKKKDAQRNRGMVENIRKQLAPTGTAIILTGSGHLPFFEKALKGAVFPLRRQAPL